MGRRCPTLLVPARCAGGGRGSWGHCCRVPVARLHPARVHLHPRHAPAAPPRGHRGVRHCCSRHHEGHPRLVLAAGGACQRTLIGMGGLCARCPPAPPRGGGSDDDNGKGASQGSGAALAPQGARGARNGAMGGRRGQTPDPGRPVLPSRRDTRGGCGAGGPVQPAPNP